MHIAERSGWLSWLQWRRTGQTPLLGVDIAPDGVRVVELHASARGYRISHHAQLPCVPDAWRQAQEGEPQALVDSIKGALKASGCRLRDAALALPASAVVTRTLCLPQPAHDEELEMLVEADAAQSLPFPRDDISLDFALLGSNAADDAMVDVLLVAARTERIAQRVAWAEAAGLKPVVVGIESLAVVAAIHRMCSDHRHAEAILHFSGDSAQCLFVHGERLLFERELGQALPVIASEDAGLDPIDHWLDATCVEWQRHAQLFAAATGDADVDRIHLAGAGSHGTLLAAGLRQRLGIDVTVPDPFQHWLHKATAAPGAPLLLACGLALRGVSR